MWFDKIINLFRSGKLLESQRKYEELEMKYTKLSVKYAELSKDWSKLYSTYINSLVKETELLSENIKLNNDSLDREFTYTEFMTNKGISVYEQILDLIKHAEMGPENYNLKLDVHSVGFMLLNLNRQYLSDEQYDELNNRLVKLSMASSTKDKLEIAPNKVRAKVLLEILKQCGLGRDEQDTTKVACLVGFIIGASPKSLRNNMESSNGLSLKDKQHGKYVEEVNQLLTKMQSKIRLKCE